MKHLKTEKNGLVFHLSATEKRLLFELLDRYPVVSPDHQRLSKTMDLAKLEEDQKLLEEALAEAKRENRKQIVALLAEPGRFRAQAGGYRLTLTAAEIDWLLQILNDIRVGSWVKLGSPTDTHARKAELTDQTAPHWWAMELSGLFQMVLLDALDSGS